MPEALYYCGCVFKQNNPQWDLNFQLLTLFGHITTRPLRRSQWVDKERARKKTVLGRGSSWDRPHYHAHTCCTLPSPLASDVLHCITLSLNLLRAEVTTLTLAKKIQVKKSVGSKDWVETNMTNTTMLTAPVSLTRSVIRTSGWYLWLAVSNSFSHTTKQTRPTCGCRRFAASAPKLRNSLPPALRDLTLTLTEFVRRLKT